MERIYNITAAVDTDIALQWAKLAGTTFLPALREVPGVKAVELIEVETPAGVETDGTRTYTVQIRFAGQEALDAFLGETEREAERALFERFGTRYVTFRLTLRSLLRV